jgi:hypothetical protein
MLDFGQNSASSIDHFLFGQFLKYENRFRYSNLAICADIHNGYVPGPKKLTEIAE